MWGRTTNKRHVCHLKRSELVFPPNRNQNKCEKQVFLSFFFFFAVFNVPHVCPYLPTYCLPQFPTPVWDGGWSLSEIQTNVQYIYVYIEYYSVPIRPTTCICISQSV